jgi:hypothetical protein
MESHNLTTQTYTAPTCTLQVSKNQQHHPGDFTLQLDHPDRGELDRITLQGQHQQLDLLQQVVSNYITELVAKFPLPNSTNNPTSAPVQSQLIETEDVAIGNHLYPSNESELPKSGLMNNLPGLRNGLKQPASVSISTPQPARAEKSSIFRSLSFWTKHHNRNKSHSGDQIKPNALATETSNLPQTPYLTGSDRSLDHQLHLGTLATPAASGVLTLSAIQLFDLATVLDEYAKAAMTTSNKVASTTVDGTNRSSKLGNDRNKTIDPTAVPLSRLPNLPKIPAEPELNQVYYRTRSRSSFMSAVPWAVAAAVAVGAPLLLLDPNPNPIKDATSKLKMPDLAGAKKSATSPPGMQPGRTAGVPGGVSPTPWQAQPVQPPANNKPLGTGVQSPQNPSKIGIAPLPDSIIGKPGQNLPTPGTVKPGVVSSILPRSGAKSGVAPNPLNTDGLPTDPKAIKNGAGLLTDSPPKTIAKPAQGKNRPAPGAQAGQLPIESISPGKLSVSKQPIAIPAIGNNLPSNQPKPFTPTEMGESVPKKPAQQKVKPAVASKPNPKAVKPTGIGVTPQPSFEPFTPVIKNPNLINPNSEQPSNSPEGSEPQNPPIIPNQPLQSNAGKESNPADNPSLQEAKRYFQGKWKANATQPNSLQYVLQVSGKSGVVRSVSPQGEAATTYLQQTKFIKPGQKLISPTTGDSSDQKIRILLEPDGNVDTFVEP